MDEQKKPRLCPLCKRHRRMETVDGLQFWIEWGGDGKPRLVACADGRRIPHMLCIEFCPLCGERMVVQAEEGT